MAKYRLLTTEELKQFEDEFVKYLVVNGITADDWVKLKKESPEKAQHVTELFSDVVFEKVLREIQFLDFVSPHVIQSVQCLKDKMVLVGIKSNSDELDLSKTPLSELKLEDFELFKGEKEYSENREVELFEMTEKGYSVSDGELFKKLILASVV